MTSATGGPGVTSDLLERIRAGDDSAWPALFARFHGRVRLYVRYRLGRALAERVEVEDVMQEAWLRALSAMERFEGGGENAFYRFLATLARHAIVDAARAARAKKRAGHVVRLDRSDWSRGGDIAARTAGPHTRAERSESMRRLEDAFASLSADQRRVIALRQFEQLPAKEVADRLDTTPAAVHAAYRRALDAWSRAANRS